MRLKNSRTTKKILKLAIVALLVLLSPNLFSAAFAQTAEPGTMQGNNQAGGPNQPTTGPGTNGLSPGAQNTQATDTTNFDNARAQVNLITQAAEQDEQQVIQNTNEELLQGTEFGAVNETYAGMSKFWGDDIIGNLFQNIGQLIGRWITEIIDGWIADTVHFLTSFLRTFVLNPNIAVNGIQNGPGAGGGDDISPYVRDGADAMYGIAVDLLLLLFILCIWKYWAEAAWRGGAGLFGAVGRLIFTAGLLLAWPTIYAFEVQITNEMINAIWFNSADQVAQLDAAMTAAVKGGLVAGIGLLANAFAPVVGAAAGGIVLGTVGEVVAFAGLVIYLFIGVILITELVYILVLKAIQTGLLTAQYMFAPIFIVFFATPDTENVTSGFVRSFVEVSLWTFVWVGLLKIMVIILYSDYNPWGKIVMAVGILQIMIQVPTFLSRASISPMSDFISAGMLTGGLMKGFSALGAMAQKRSMQAVDYFTNQQFGSRGMPQSKKMSASPGTASDPDLVNSLKNRKPGDGKETGGERDPITGMPIVPPTGRGRGDNKEGEGKGEGEGEGKDLRTPQQKAEDEKKKNEEKKNEVPPTKKDLDATLKNKQPGGVPDPTKAGEKDLAGAAGKEGAEGAKEGEEGKKKEGEGEGAPAAGAGQGAGLTRPSARELGRRLANSRVPLAPMAAAALVGAGLAGSQANQANATAQSDAEKASHDNADREAQNAQTLNTANESKDPNAKGDPNAKKDGTEKPGEKPLHTKDDAEKNKDEKNKEQIAALAAMAMAARNEHQNKTNNPAGNKEQGKPGSEDGTAAKLDTEHKDGGVTQKLTDGTGPVANPKFNAATARQQAAEDAKKGLGPLAPKGGGTGTQGPGSTNQPINTASDVTEEGDAENLRNAAGGVVSGLHSVNAKAVIPINDPKGKPDGDATKPDASTSGTSGPPAKKADGDQPTTPGAIATDVKPTTETKAGNVASLVTAAALAKNLPGLAGIKPVTPAGAGSGVQGKGADSKAEEVVQDLAGDSSKNPVSLDKSGNHTISVTQGQVKGSDGKIENTNATAETKVTGQSAQNAETKLTGHDTQSSSLTPGAANITGVSGIPVPPANPLNSKLPQALSPISKPISSKTGAPVTSVDKQGSGSAITTEQSIESAAPGGVVVNAQGEPQKVIQNLVSVAGPGQGQVQIPGKDNVPIEGKPGAVDPKTGAPLAPQSPTAVQGLTPPTGIQALTPPVASPTGAQGNTKLPLGLAGIRPISSAAAKTTVQGPAGTGNSVATTESLATENQTGITQGNPGELRVTQNFVPGSAQSQVHTADGKTNVTTETNKAGAPTVTPSLANAPTPPLQTPTLPTALGAASSLANAAMQGRIPNALPTTKVPAAQAQSTQTLHSSGGSTTGEITQEPGTVPIALTGDNAERTIRVTAGNPEARVTGIQSQSPASTVQTGHSGQSPTLGAGVVPPVSALSQAQTPVPPSAASPTLAAVAQHSSPVRAMATQAQTSLAQMQGRMPDQTMAAQETQNLEAILIDKHGLSPEKAAAIARTGLLSVTATPAGQQTAQPGQTPNQSASIPLQSQGAAPSSTAQSLQSPPRLGAATTPLPGSSPGSARVVGFQSIPGSGGGGGGGNDGMDFQMSNDGSPPRPGGGRTPTGPAQTGFSNFDQDNYRWVPLRNLANDIRTFQGPQQGMSREDDGHGTTTMGAKGISNVKYGKDTTDSQKAMHMMAAGYAQVFTTDPAAYDAARQATIDAGGDAPQGIGQRIAANLLAYNGKSFKQTSLAKQQFTQGLYQQAMTGAEAYVNGGEGNAYTDYLRGRWGSMSSEQQAWGVHIMTDPTSPESGWSTTLQASGDTLTKAGMPINAENRAAASNQTVLRQAQWARGLATRGVAAYSVALAEQQLGPNAHSMERDALVGRIAPGLGSDYVEACRAIMEAAPTADLGARMCSDPTTVQSVAGTVAQARAQGLDIDASTAYKNLMGPARVMGNRMTGSQTVDVMSGGGGGGGFSPVSAGGASMMPNMGAVQNDTVIDQTFNNAGFVPTSGSVGHVGSTSSYVPGVGILGQTTMRPSGGFSSVHAQTNRASMDVHGTVLSSSTPIAAPGSLTAAAFGSSTIQTDSTIETVTHISNAGLQNSGGNLGSQVISGGVGSVPGRVTTNFVPGRGSGVQNNMTGTVQVDAQVRNDGVIPGNVSVPTSAMGDGQQPVRVDAIVNSQNVPGTSTISGISAPGATIGNRVTANYSFVPGKQQGSTVQNLQTETVASNTNPDVQLGNTGSGVVTEQTNMHVQTNVVNAPGLGPVIPSFNNLSSAQQIRQQIRLDVTNTGLSNPSLGQQNFNLNESVQADARHAAPDFSVSGSGNDNSSTYVQQGFAEVFVRQEASAGGNAGFLQNEVNSVGASAANRMGSNMHVAKQIVIDMMAAGFENEHIQDPRIASVAMQVSQKDSSMMGAAAIAARVMNPEEYSVQTVETVQQMVDAGWGGRSISRPDVITSRMVIDQGIGDPQGRPDYGYPEPRLIQEIRRIREFVPEMNSMSQEKGMSNRIPEDFATEYMSRKNNNNLNSNNSGNYSNNRPSGNTGRHSFGGDDDVE